MESQRKRALLSPRRGSHRGRGSHGIGSRAGTTPGALRKSRRVRRCPQRRAIRDDRERRVNSTNPVDPRPELGGRANAARADGEVELRRATALGQVGVRERALGSELDAADGRAIRTSTVTGPRTANAFPLRKTSDVELLLTIRSSSYRRNKTAVTGPSFTAIGNVISMAICAHI